MVPPQLRGAVIAAVDDLKILIRGVRAWGTAEDARAAERTRELSALAPAAPRAAAPTPVAAAGSAAFLAIQTADVAAGLQAFADHPGTPASFAETLARIRALRGVAALLDLPPLAEVVAAVDDAAKGLELGSTTATRRPARAVPRGRPRAARRIRCDQGRRPARRGHERGVRVHRRGAGFRGQSLPVILKTILHFASPFPERRRAGRRGK